MTSCFALTSNWNPCYNTRREQIGGGTYCDRLSSDLDTTDIQVCCIEAKVHVRDNMLSEQEERELTQAVLHRSP